MKTWDKKEEGNSEKRKETLIIFKTQRETLMKRGRNLQPKKESLAKRGHIP